MRAFDFLTSDVDMVLFPSRLIDGEDRVPDTRFYLSFLLDFFKMPIKKKRGKRTRGFWVALFYFFKFFMACII